MRTKMSSRSRGFSGSKQQHAERASTVMASLKYLVAEGQDILASKDCIGALRTFIWATHVTGIALAHLGQSEVPNYPALQRLYVLEDKVSQGIDAAIDCIRQGKSR